jgi:DNA-binding MarR family transcriptional regulator
VLEFMQALWALDHALHSTSKRMRAALGITGPQRLVMRVVGRYPGISAGDIAGVLHSDPSTLTGVLDRLQRKGLLERRSDPDDRRRAAFHLSRAGRDLDRLRGGTVELAVARTLERSSQRDLRGARRLIGALEASLWQVAREAMRAARRTPRAAAARGRRGPAARLGR